MNEGISRDALTEKEEFIKFEAGRTYVVPAHKKHQIIHDADMNDIGIAIARNGRKDFRDFDNRVCYWYTGPYAYIVISPVGESVDLSRIV